MRKIIEEVVANEKKAKKGGKKSNKKVRKTTTQTKISMDFDQKKVSEGFSLYKV